MPMLDRWTYLLKYNLVSVQKLYNIRQNTSGSRLLLFSGTLFLEVWKRKQAELAYQWDVEQFEENEPDRPEFYGTKPCVVSISVVNVVY